MPDFYMGGTNTDGTTGGAIPNSLEVFRTMSALQQMEETRQNVAAQ
jgi:hypothetical protein